MHTCVDELGCDGEEVHNGAPMIVLMMHTVAHTDFNAVAFPHGFTIIFFSCFHTDVRRYCPLPALLDTALLASLCELLQHPDLRQGSADCLLIVANRKGPLPDRAPLMAVLDNFVSVLGHGGFD